MQKASEKRMNKPCKLREWPREEPVFYAGYKWTIEDRRIQYSRGKEEKSERYWWIQMDESPIEHIEARIGIKGTYLFVRTSISKYEITGNSPETFIVIRIQGESTNEV